MSSYPAYLQNKAKMKYEMLDKKNRQKPNIKDELEVNKSLLQMQNELSRPEKEIDQEMAQELKESWKGPRQGGGEALVSGFMGGMKKRSILDDKKRMQGLIGTTEKLKSMVEQQNQMLHRQQVEAEAKDYIKPRVMAYLDQSQRMAPDARRVYLQAAMDEYNKMAGTNFQILDATGTEPWKVVVSNNGDSQIIDLMDFIKTPEEKKYELYMNSNEMKMADAAAMQEYNMGIQAKQSQINSNNAKANKYSNQAGNSPEFFTTDDGAQIDVSNYPSITTAREKNMYSSTFTGMSKILRELEDTYNEVSELESMTKGNMFSPFGSQAGSLPNKIKDFTAKNPNADKDVAKEVVLRNKIESRFQQLQPILERYLKGSAPDSQLLKRMHEKGVYPESNQSFPVIKSKLEMLMHTVKEDRDVAGASLRSGRQIPFLPDVIQNPEQRAQTGEQQAQGVKYQLSNGQTVSIPTENSQEFLNAIKQKGLTATVIQ